MRTLLVVVIVGLGPSAIAQGARDDLAVKRAQAYVDLGTELFKNKQLAEALVEFQRAKEMEAKVGALAVVRWNIARCLEELGRGIEAVEAFEAFLELPGSSEAQRAVAKAKIDAIVPRFFGALEVQCAPADARVSLSGREGSVPCPAKLDRVAAGSYVLKVFTDDTEKEEEITVAAGGNEILDVVVPALLKIDANVKGAKAFLDGKPVGATPATVRKHQAGSYVVIVKRPGQPPWTTEVALEPGRAVSVEARFATPGGENPSPGAGGGWLASPIVKWGSAGIAGAALIGGAVFYVSASTGFSDAKTALQQYDLATDPTTTARLRGKAVDANDGAESDRTLAYVLLGAGAAVGGFATWLFLRQTPTAQKRTQVGIAPAPGGGLVVLGGAF